MNERLPFAYHSQLFPHATFSQTTMLPLVSVAVVDGMVKSVSSDNCTIREGLQLSQVTSTMQARVIRAFSIHIEPVKGGYVATSHLSDIYEFEATRGDVVRHYLSSLLDELCWLRENKSDLSDSLLRELGRIESSIEIDD